MAGANGRFHAVGTPTDVTGDPGSPLGLRPGARLDTAQRKVVEALHAYDLSPLRSYLLKHGIMPTGWVDEAIFEFRRFLAVRLITTGPLFMVSRQVDDVWHAAIVNTRLYADLCARTLGFFVHHDPIAAPDPAAAWDEFATLYRELFGEPGRLWMMWRPGRDRESTRL